MSPFLKPLFAAIISGSLFCASHVAAKANPSRDEILGSYKSWTKVSDQALSIVHWEKMVVSYVNLPEASEIYKHNYNMQLLELDGAWPEEIEEEGGWKPYPIGTIVAKENFNDKKQADLDSVTIMIKSAEKKWHYLQYDANGKEVINNLKDHEAAYTKCIECHENVSHRDFIYHTQTAEVASILEPRVNIAAQTSMLNKKHPSQKSTQPNQ